MTQETESKRGRGRPQSFPGQETVTLLARVPANQREQLRVLAEKRGVPLNVALAAIIERAHKDATRTRAKAPAPVAG